MDTNNSTTTVRPHNRGLLANAGGLLAMGACLVLVLPGCESRTMLLKCAFDDDSCVETDSSSWSESDGYGSDSEGPVMCEGEDDCTAEASGDVGPTEVPFFRGTVCMPTAVQPGDSVPITLAACIHPCLSNSPYAFKSLSRCTTGEDMSVSCEAAPVLWFNDVTGGSCPSDVFGKFDKSLCKWIDPVQVDLGPLTIGGGPYSGEATVMIPFLKNEDASLIAAGSHSSSELFSLIETRPQDPARSIALSLAEANPAAPANCEAEGSCNCMDIGF